MPSPMPLSFYKLASLRITRSKLPCSKGNPRLKRLNCVINPQRIFSASLNPRSASFIILLCIPALALFISTTLPTWIFPSSEQAAYHYFANAFTHDLSKGYLLALSVLCILLAPAVPAATLDADEALRI